MRRRVTADRERNFDLSRVCEAQTYRDGFAFGEWRADAVEHQMRAAGTKRDFAPSWNHKRRGWPHAHDAIVHRHFVHLDALSARAGGADQSVCARGVICDGEIA